MKSVLVLLNSDRFAMPLINYLGDQGKVYGWKVTVASMFDVDLFDRMKALGRPDLTYKQFKDQKQCDKEIRQSDLVIALMPDVMLLNVADTCIRHSKKLISPTRLNRQLFAKKSQAEENDALILVECGFTPGLDHITAKKMIDHIHAKGGRISSFKTYSGNLLEENSIDNPWAFKLSGPAYEILNFGKGQNRYLINGQLQQVPYHQLFLRTEPITIAGIGDAVMVPEDDGLYCRKIYDLPEAGTVMKARIVRKGFDSVWALILRLGLTNASHKIEMPTDPSFRNFLRSLVPYSPSESLESLLKHHAGAADEDIEKLKWLGLFDDEWFEGMREITPAIMLQYLMESKLSMRDDDRDVIVVRHDLEYTLNSYSYKFNATLISEGTDLQQSALAKAISLTTGAAAKAVLMGNIKVKGIHTPVKKRSTIRSLTSWRIWGLRLWWRKSVRRRWTLRFKGHVKRFSRFVPWCLCALTTHSYIESQSNICDANSRGSARGRSMDQGPRGALF